MENNEEENKNEIVNAFVFRGKIIRYNERETSATMTIHGSDPNNNIADVPVLVKEDAFKSGKFLGMEQFKVIEIAGHFESKMNKRCTDSHLMLVADTVMEVTA